MTSAHRQRLNGVYGDLAHPHAIDLWTAHYATGPLEVAISDARHTDPARQEIENETWARAIPRGGRVLDLGCGRGFFCDRVAEALDGRVAPVGLDLSETVLRMARHERPALPLVCADGESLPVGSSSVDTVLLVSAVEQMEDASAVIRETHRVLKSGGHLYLCLHRPHLDPFVLPSLVSLAWRLIRKPFRMLSRSGGAGRHIGFKGALPVLRRRLRGQLKALGFERVETRALMVRFEWSFYRRVTPWIVPGLIRLAARLNRLPLGYAKDLESWLLRKS